uniref:Uncharacterized protein n=1 Tax=viral metagenome TaxID=1070528 RepID=A0A6C0HNU8_9ZZZZ
MEPRVPCVMVFKPPTFSEAIMVELRKDDIARGYYGKRKEAFLKWLEQSNEPSSDVPSEAPSSEAPTKRERSLSEDRKTKRQKTD